MQAYAAEQIASPDTNIDRKSIAHKGRIAVAMLQAYEASCEDQCTLWKKPIQTIKVDADFKTRDFELTAMTPSISIVLDKEGKCTVTESATCLSLGPLFDHGGEKARGFLRAATVLPPEDAAGKVLARGTTVKESTSFVSTYWLVRSTSVKSESNCAREAQIVSVKAEYDKDHKKEANIKVPVIVNTKPLKEGDELLYYKAPDKVSEASIAKGSGLQGLGKASGKSGKVGKGKGKTGKGK